MFRKVNMFMRGRFRGDGVRPRMRTVMAERAQRTHQKMGQGVSGPFKRRGRLSHSVAFATPVRLRLASDGPPKHHRTPSHRCVGRKENPL